MSTVHCAYTFTGVYYWSLPVKNVDDEFEQLALFRGRMRVGVFRGDTLDAALRTRPLGQREAFDEPRTDDEWREWKSAPRGEPVAEEAAAVDPLKFGGAFVVVRDEMRQLPLAHCGMRVTLRLVRSNLLKDVAVARDYRDYVYSVRSVISMLVRNANANDKKVYSLVSTLVERPAHSLAELMSNNRSAELQVFGGASGVRSKPRVKRKLSAAVSQRVVESSATLAEMTHAVNNSSLRQTVLLDGANVFAFEHLIHQSALLRSTDQPLRPAERINELRAFLWKTLKRFGVDDAIVRRTSYAEHIMLARFVGALDKRSDEWSAVQLLFFGSLQPHTIAFDTPNGIYSNWPGDSRRQLGIEASGEKLCLFALRFLSADAESGIRGDEELAKKVGCAAHRLATQHFEAKATLRRRRAVCGLENVLAETCVEVEAPARNRVQVHRVHMLAVKLLLCAKIWVRTLEDGDHEEEDVLNLAFETVRDHKRSSAFAQLLQATNPHVVHACGTDLVRLLHAAMAPLERKERVTVFLCGGALVARDDAAESWLACLLLDTNVQIADFTSLLDTYAGTDSNVASARVALSFAQSEHWLFVDAHFLDQRQLSIALRAARRAHKVRVTLVGDSCVAESSPFAHWKRVASDVSFVANASFGHFSNQPLAAVFSHEPFALAKLNRFVFLTTLSATTRDDLRAALCAIECPKGRVKNALAALARQSDLLGHLERTVFLCAPFISFDQRTLLHVEQFYELHSLPAAHEPICVDNAVRIIPHGLRTHVSLDNSFLLAHCAAQALDHRICCGTWHRDVMFVAQHRHQLASQSFTLAHAARPHDHVDALVHTHLLSTGSCTVDIAFAALANTRAKPGTIKTASLLECLPADVSMTSNTRAFALHSRRRDGE